MLKTMDNTTLSKHTQKHTLKLKHMCPVSKNPQSGKIIITYTPNLYFLEVYSLRKFIDSFIGGREYNNVYVRDMEQTIICIKKECELVLQVPVHVKTVLMLDTQEMELDNV